MLVAKMEFKGFFQNRLLTDWVKDGYELYISGPKLTLRTKKGEVPFSFGRKTFFEIENDSLIVHKVDEREELEHFRRKYYRKFKIPEKYLKGKQVAKAIKIEDIYVMFANGEYKIPPNSNIYLEKIEIFDDDKHYQIASEIIEAYNRANNTYQYLQPNMPTHSINEETFIGGDLGFYDVYNENLVEFPEEISEIPEISEFVMEDEELPFG